MPSITVTDVKIFPFTPQKGKSAIKAFVEITINDSLVIKGLKIIDGSKGLFLGMPAVKGKNNEYKDQVYPTNKETRKLLTDAILKAYNDNGDKLFEE